MNQTETGCPFDCICEEEEDLLFGTKGFCKKLNDLSEYCYPEGSSIATVSSGSDLGEGNQRRPRRKPKVFLTK